MKPNIKREENGNPAPGDKGRKRYLSKAHIGRGTKKSTFEKLEVIE